ncbi:DUF1127 domain-containing protein [Edaphovirga cremea]|uniref:DUF1127 domain-containing protein n=1 Tax=Edaphovirga cremea TaxID=2267246 RepID=UPI000DEEEE95|nr:DUF1127 domain-containing protein [Edaphovirga cremea]
MKQTPEIQQSLCGVTQGYVTQHCILPATTQTSEITHESLWQKICTLYQSWHLRYTSRRVLQSLSDDQLRDIGLTRDDVTHESRKNFWQ